MMSNIYSASNGRAQRILLWHWGKEGAGAKFTMALGSALANNNRDIHISAASESDLANNLRGQDTLPSTSVAIFNGDKSKLSGKLSAAMALFKLPFIGSDFKSIRDSFQPDLQLCSFQSIWDLAALPVLKSGKQPYILCLHDAAPHPGDDYPFRSTALKMQIEATDGLIVLSDHVADAANKYYHYPKERIFKIPHGRFDFSNQEIKPRAFPSDRPFHLLFLGRITKYKGLSELLDAYELLPSTSYPLKLTIAGSGDLGSLRARIDQHANITLIHEWLSDETISHCLQEADAIILPYQEASQSGIAATAFAAGLPVIATPVGGLTEQIKHRHTGLIAQSMSASSLAHSIRELSTCDTLYENLSRGALHHAATALNWNEIGATLGEALDHLIKLPRRRNAT